MYLTLRESREHCPHLWMSNSRLLWTDFQRRSEKHMVLLAVAGRLKAKASEAVVLIIHLEDLDSIFVQ